MTKIKSFNKFLVFFERRKRRTLGGLPLMNEIEENIFLLIIFLNYNCF